MSFCYYRFTTYTPQKTDHAGFAQVSIIYRTNPRYIASII